MTVAELITKLQALPSHKTVVLVDDEGRVSELSDAYEGFVRHDVDMFCSGNPACFEIEEMLEDNVEPDYVVGVIAS